MKVGRHETQPVPAVAEVARWRLTTLWLTAAGLAVLHVARAGEPLAHEELTWWFELARSWLWTGTFAGASGAAWADHPPLYGLLLAGTFTMAGEGVRQARALGLAAGLASLVVVARLAAAIAQRERLRPGSRRSPSRSTGSIR